MMWLLDGEKSLRMCLFMSTQYTNVSDGGTDRQTDRYRMTAYCALAAWLGYRSAAVGIASLVYST